MWRVLMATFVGLVVGCSRPIGSISAPAPSSVPFAALSEAEQKAVQSAGQLLGGQGVLWGQPESVKLTPDGKAYWITYPVMRHDQDQSKVADNRASAIRVGSNEGQSPRLQCHRNVTAM
jgi:hypothetical protein